MREILNILYSYF